MTYLSFGDAVKVAVGEARWVLAPKLSAALRAKGYEVAIPAKRYDALREEWIANHPVYVLASTLPPSSGRDLILRAVRRELGLAA